MPSLRRELLQDLISNTLLPVHLRFFYYSFFLICFRLTNAITFRGSCSFIHTGEAPLKWLIPHLLAATNPQSLQPIDIKSMVLSSFGAYFQSEVPYKKTHRSPWGRTENTLRTFRTHGVASSTTSADNSQNNFLTSVIRYNGCAGEHHPTMTYGFWNPYLTTA